MKKKIKDNSAGSEDFLKYLGSEMTSSERNVFEKDLQKDPFASEAIDGFAEINAGEAKKDLNELKKDLKNNIYVNKRFKNYYYGIAASVAVLMILSSVWIFVQRNKQELTGEKNAMEMIQPQVDEPLIPDEPVSIPIVAESQPAQKMIKKEVPEKEKKSDEEIIETTQAENIMEIKITDNVKPAAGYIARDNISEKAAKTTVPVNQVSDSDASLRREINAVASAESISDSSNKLVTISGYSEAKNKVMSNVSSPAEPVGGMNAFEKYVESEIRIPSSIKKGDRKIVVVEVIIKETGETGEIKVIRSPATEFSDEAKRLIKEGPAWNPALIGGKNIESKVRLRIVFEVKNDNI